MEETIDILNVSFVPSIANPKASVKIHSNALEHAKATILEEIMKTVRGSLFGSAKSGMTTSTNATPQTDTITPETLKAWVGAAKKLGGHTGGVVPSRQFGKSMLVGNLRAPTYIPRGTWLISPTGLMTSCADRGVVAFDELDRALKDTQVWFGPNYAKEPKDWDDKKGVPKAYNASSQAEQINRKRALLGLEPITAPASPQAHSHKTKLAVQQKKSAERKRMAHYRNLPDSGQF